MSLFRNRDGSHFGAQFGLSQAVALLLAANIGIYVLQFLIRGFTGHQFLEAWGSFIPYFAIREMQIWRFVTYMFLHGSFGHLFFNMLGLWLFGSRLEAHWGTRTFAWFYFVSGIGGGLLYGAASLAGVEALQSMVGASGAVYGLLLAFGLAFPNAIIFLVIFPVPARIAVFVFGAMSLFGVGGAGIAHLAHLGGMLTGLIFLWYFTGGHPSQIPHLPGSGRARRSPGQWSATGQPRSSARQAGLLERLQTAYHRWRTKQRLRVVDDERGKKDRAARPDGGTPRGREEKLRIDEILEKISREGLQSLTADEQEILRNASRKK